MLKIKNIYNYLKLKNKNKFLIINNYKLIYNILMTYPKQCMKNMLNIIYSIINLPLLNLIVVQVKQNK